MGSSVDPKLINKKIRDQIILGIIPKGTILKIVDVRHKTTFEDEYYHFDVTIEDEKYKKWGILDAFWLVERDYPPNGFREKFVTFLD